MHIAIHCHHSMHDKMAAVVIYIFVNYLKRDKVSVQNYLRYMIASYENCILVIFLHICIVLFYYLNNSMMIRVVTKLYFICQM